jgi:o-succinylbenzoate synthase
LKEPFRISSGVVEQRRICLLELEDASGAVGWSECVAGEFPNYSPETIDTAWHAIKHWAAPRIIGKSFQHPREVLAALQQDFRGHEMAKAAVEMGCWEVAAQLQQVPLSKLLGGTRARVPVGVSLGYRKIKLKIQPGSDVEFVRAVRGALPHTELMADANNAYTLDDAEHLAQLDEFELMMIEQPLEREDLVRHAELQKRLRTPLCLDESITSVARAEDMIALRSGRIINIKPGRVGGFTSSIAIHDVSQQHDIPVWCGGMLESGVGRAHNVALASLPNFSLPGDLSPSSRYWERDIVIPEWTMDAEGMVDVPTKPGIGVTIDRDRVEDLTVRCLAIDGDGT